MTSARNSGRVPDHRKETPSFEMGGQVTGPREEPAPSFGPDLFESAPAPATAGAGAGGWEPATPDEIANYDLSGSGSDPLPNRK